MRAATFWDRRWARGSERRPDESEKIDWIASTLPERVGVLLDVGCGTGWMLAALRDRCDRVLGVEISDEALRQVEGADVVLASATRLPFRDGSVDVALCSEVLEHLREDAAERAAAELARVTRRSVVVTVPFDEKRLLNMVRCTNCLTEFHSSLHMRSLTHRDVIEPFLRHGLRPAALRLTGRMRYRSETLARMNAALTGYHSFWRPGLVCPLCERETPMAGRARTNPLSFVLEALNHALGLLAPARPRSLCVLFEHRPSDRSGARLAASNAP